MEQDPARPPTIFLIAGEPSGDALGAALMAALSRRLGGHVQFCGVGGEAMIDQGLASLFPMSDLSVMGLTEVLPRLPLLLRRIRQTVAGVRERRPDIVVSIDAPDFSFRVGRQLAADAVPLVHYVAPTVWAWRPGRARAVAQFLDHLMALLPFEPPYFEREGLDCTYVGHPALEAGFNRGNGERFRRAHGLTEGQPVLTVLPGSRRGELARLLPVFGDTMRRLVYRHPALVVAVPVVPHLAKQIEIETANWPLRAVIVRGERDKIDAFAASTAALAASGTVSLQLALARVPQVIAYRVNALTAWAARRLIRVQHASLPNIILGRGVVPELLQNACEPIGLGHAVADLLEQPKLRQAQINAFEDMAKIMGEGEMLPSERAADVILTLLARKADHTPIKDGPAA
jgi:lipid-A-disaccharide synthase